MWRKNGKNEKMKENEKKKTHLGPNDASDIVWAGFYQCYLPSLTLSHIS